MLRIKLYLGLATSRDAENLQNFVSVVVKNQVVPRSRYVYGVLNFFFTKVYEISITQRRSGDPSGAIFISFCLAFIMRV